MLQQAKMIDFGNYTSHVTGKSVLEVGHEVKTFDKDDMQDITDQMKK